MRDVGFILRQARLSKKLTLTQLSRLTKIPKETLKFLEKNSFDKLPSATYIKGFIKNCSPVLGLNADETIAVFRRDFKKLKTSKILPQGMVKPLNRNFSPFVILNKTTTALVLAALLLLAYLGISLSQLYQPPKLTVTFPAESQEVTIPVLIKGKTDHDAILTLDGKVINLEPDGSFTTVYRGQAGTVNLVLEATSRRHRATKINRYFIIVPEQ